MAKNITPEAPALSLADEARLALNQKYGTPLNRRMTRLAFAMVLGCPDDSYPMTDDQEPEFSRFNHHLQLLDYTFNVAWWDEAVRGLYADLDPRYMFMVMERMISHAEGKLGPEGIHNLQLLAGLMPVLEAHGKDYRGFNDANRTRHLETVSRKINQAYTKACRIYGEDPAARGHFL